jgi:hypothetical protein
MWAALVGRDTKPKAEGERVRAEGDGMSFFILQAQLVGASSFKK